MLKNCLLVYGHYPIYCRLKNNFEKHIVLGPGFGVVASTQFAVIEKVFLSRNNQNASFFWKSCNSVLGAGLEDASTTHFAVI